MEYNKAEMEVVQKTVDSLPEVELRTLSELELLMTGGGSGDVSFK